MNGTRGNRRLREFFQTPNTDTGLYAIAIYLLTIARFIDLIEIS